MVIAIVMTAAGLFMLLYGLNLMRSSLERFAGIHFQNALIRLTKTPLRSFLSGVGATGILQSSTALTVMAVSFVDSRLIRFENTLGLILGTNIGATITPQLLAFPFKDIAIWSIPAGILGFMFTRKKPRYLFLAVVGLGLMFLALLILESAMLPLAQKPQLQGLLHHIGNNHLYSILAGTLLSGLLHSSSAATGIAMVLTEEGWLNLPAAFAFIFGANIGTCFTALIVSLFASRPAQRVALFHILINVFGVIVFYPFLTPVSDLIASAGGNLSRQVANAHTVFNVVSSVLFLPLLPYATRLLAKLK